MTKRVKKITKTKSKVDELLLSALGSEMMAIDFYNDAAQKAQSQAGRTFFNEMANFEKAHFENVKKIILSRGQKSALAIYESNTKAKSIKPEVKGEFEPNKDEIIDVLIIAIRAEKDAKERYLKISKMMPDKKSKQIFINLSEDERLHQNMLEEQFYQLSNKGLIIWE